MKDDCLPFRVEFILPKECLEVPTDLPPYPVERVICYIPLELQKLMDSGKIKELTPEIIEKYGVVVEPLFIDK